MKRLSLSRQILIMLLVAIAAITAISLFAQRRIISQQGVDLTRNTMKAMVVEGENVRESISQLNNRGAFDFDQLKAELAQHSDYRDATIYRTIPVVAAWEAIAEAAQGEGYEFRVVREDPRNPKNAPDPREQAILQSLQASGDEEFFELDRSAGIMTYARPIVLSRDCLSCHGDPARSPTGDGKDLLGFEMENWKSGEMRGAFILSGSLDGIDQVVASGFSQSLLWVLPAAAAAIILSILLLRRHTIEPLLGSINSIREASRQTDSAASSISNASQDLASGACRSAAGIQESSSIISEVLGSTTRGSERARSASALSSETATMAKGGGHRMDELLRSMEDIRSSSDAVTQIISTIDEIAFQTNLLALNAAVEAARAGEAGAGFSVVADEVRGLSQRTAKAARNTNELIKQAIDSSQRGSAISQAVKQDLDAIIANSQTLDLTVESVAESYREQEVRVQKIASVIADLDQITQANAAGAEETASASEELNAQASLLEEMIAQMSARLLGRRK